MTKSQKVIVLEHLQRYGKMSTKQAMRRNIKRLAVMIERLRKEGYKILTVNECGDRYYRLETKTKDKHK